MIPAYAENGIGLFGGGERYAFNVALALGAYCDVTLVTFGSRRQERQIDQMRHVVVQADGRDPENPVPRPGFFLHERFDVIHVFQLRSVATSLLAVLSRLKRTPLVVTDVGGGGRSLMFRLQLYRLVSSFILISEFSRQLIPYSVRDRAAVVKGGIDLHRFTYDPRPRKKQVVQVGRIMPHKGFNYLIEAAGDDIPVVIAGRVKDEEYFRLLQDLSGGKQVTFLTDADDETVEALYRTSAVTVGASVYRDVWNRSWPNSELLGLTLLESMAVGTPVVCTRVGGMPEYVVDGEDGYVVPPNDPVSLRAKLLELLGDPGRAQEMGRTGRDHVTAYTWDRVAGQVAAQYQRLI